MQVTFEGRVIGEGTHEDVFGIIANHYESFYNERRLEYLPEYRDDEMQMNYDEPECLRVSEAVAMGYKIIGRQC